MNRRDLVKKLGLAALASTLPALSVKANTTTSRIIPGYFEFNVGKLTLVVVTDGHAVFKPVQPTFAPGIPSEEVANVLKDNFLATDSADLAFNVLVLKHDGRVVLFDTGCGANFGPTSGKLLVNLESAGIKSTDVTDILLTHGHPDHVGGILKPDGKLAFANAQVHIASDEYRFWTGPNPDFSKAKNLDKAFADSMVQLAVKTFSELEGRLKLFNNDELLFGCVRTRIVPGHTPGHTLTTIFSGDEMLLHMGDISHHHALLLSHPEWGVTFDTDFKQAASARKQLLEQMAVTRARLFSYHLPWPGLGFVRKKGKGYEWVPQSYSSPQL